MIKYSDKLYKKVRSAGAAGITLGIISIVVGLTVGILSITFGGSMLNTTKELID
ncbi:hypothetical protein [Vallitalea okinawensis]|uniref:hypothetical protein n=1 Tax=Vallitalea okinawensis TaxID=2078660 RepID=UPI0014780C94|nr:hypothetical protein [Vallitalea okinawensis]